MASSPLQTPLPEEVNEDSAAPAPQIPDNREHTEIPPANPSSDPPADTHRCFVCLVDEPEASLPEDWSTPCTCALEGHQECLMCWITDLESQGKDIKCPLCKSPITVTELSDFAIQLSNYMHRKFSKWSPRILFGFLASGTLVSSSIYGAKAIDWFAGPGTTLDFLLTAGGTTITDMLRDPKGVRAANQPLTINFLHFAVLPLIAPGLILNRLRQGEVILIPVSFLYATLIDETHEYFTWPPSPQRALAIYPTIKATYFHLHHILSKRLEKRWKAKAAELLPNDGGENHERQPALQNDPEPQPEAGNNLLDFEIDIQINLEDGDENVDVRGNRGLDGGRSPVNFIAGALIWPGVCYSMGQLLRLALPWRYTTRPASGPITGILQERWGRSLVGGCLFVVLKDAFFLWVKYRRTITRASRRIKNAENRQVRR